MSKETNQQGDAEHTAVEEGWSHFGIQTHKQTRRADGREGCCGSSSQLLHPSKLLLSPPLLRSHLSYSSQTLR